MCFVWASISVMLPLIPWPQCLHSLPDPNVSVSTTITAPIHVSVLEAVTVSCLLKHGVRTANFFVFRLRGSYQNLHGGYISDALVDFTGGVQLQFSLKKPPPDLQEILKAAGKSRCMMGCSTSGQVSREARSTPFLVYYVCIKGTLLSEEGSPQSL